MRIDATIQARMSSSRLPGKTLKPIVGKPMLALQVERLQQSMLLDRIILATSTNPIDDPIDQLAGDLGVLCFRGSEDDVLGRVVGALKAFGVELHAEFQGDNPMPDPLLVDAVIGFYLKHANEFDYVTNSMKTTYPPGAEISVYPARVLVDIEPHVTELREHVGIHVQQRPGIFRLWNLEAPPWLHEPTIHLEVDTAEDFELVSRVFEHFYPTNPGFSLIQAVEFVKERQLDKMNRHVDRRWRSFRQED